MKIQVKTGSWSDMGPMAALVRRAVFVQEQGIPESEEWDEADEASLHAVAWVDDELAGTGRLLPQGKIGRMAVYPAYRQRGVGSAILLSLIEQARVQRMSLISLSSQASACGFYARFGFKPVGAPHVEVGIDHQWMSLAL